MKKRYFIYLPLLFAFILVSGIYLGYRLSPVTSHPQLFSFNPNKYNKLNDVVNYIVREYVDSVNKEELTKEGIYGILEKLDPHSQYISAEEFDEVNDPLLGNFEGIGIQFRIENDSIIVIHPIPGGPSEKVGLLAGDRIVMVDDSLVAGVGIDNLGAMKKLKGKRGTHVSVAIFRRGLADLLHYEIIRDVIPTYSVDIAFMPEDTIGYIKISKFSATTFDEFKEAADKLLMEECSILYWTYAIQVVTCRQLSILPMNFFENDKLIVFTEGQNQPRESFYATGKGSLVTSA
ncbi:MAG: PDZ domain-containing protein [Bacteroidales bacterium]